MVRLFPPMRVRAALPLVLVAVVAAALTVLPAASAYEVSGDLFTDHPFAFLGKFCFNPADEKKPGQFDFELTYPRNSSIKLLVYW